ncbi:Nitroreductase family protein [Candidatus Tiddalikarchaeum anstoanum]|nr:Nitroreductase family protein [Candidatus Tiddalikarchaeum anstoanum]
MEFNRLIDDRHSVRVFLPKKVPRQAFHRILKACQRAPSAGNLQSYELVVITDEKKKKELCNAAYGQECIIEAPIVLVFLADTKKSGHVYGERGKELYALQDATIACAYSQLMATNVGVASVWIGAFDEEMVKNLVNTKEYRPIAILPIGYPGEKIITTPRRELERFVHDERFEYK